MALKEASLSSSSVGASFVSMACVYICVRRVGVWERFNRSRHACSTDVNQVCLCLQLLMGL